MPRRRLEACREGESERASEDDGEEIEKERERAANIIGVPCRLGRGGEG